MWGYVWRIVDEVLKLCLIVCVFFFFFFFSSRRRHTRLVSDWSSDVCSSDRTGNATLADAMKSADVFLGVSVPGMVTPEMVASMADRKSVV